MSTRPCTECVHLNADDVDGNETHCRQWDAYVVVDSPDDCSRWSQKMTDTPGRQERARVAKQIVRCIQNPIRLMTIPERDEAYRLANDYNISAKELLDAARGLAENT